MVSGIFALENWFLIFLGVVWIIGAVLQDIKRREVDNLWNFSLIAFALAYRLIISIWVGDYWFVLNGVLGFVIFLGLGNLFYYCRLFAGGDAKLVIALGAILPLSYNWITNLEIFGAFILLFLICGSIYALIWAFCLVFINFKDFKKEFVKLWKIYKKMFLIALAFAILWSLFAILMNRVFLILIGLVILLFPVLFVFAKAVENCYMIKSVKPNKVTLGDWLYEDILIGGKKIKSNWEGVTEKELKLIQKKCRKNILIKQGIPFTPSFLFGFIVLLWLAWRYGWF